VSCVGSVEKSDPLRVEVLAETLQGAQSMMLSILALTSLCVLGIEGKQHSVAADTQMCLCISQLDVITLLLSMLLHRDSEKRPPS